MVKVAYLQQSIQTPSLVFHVINKINLIHFHRYGWCHRTNTLSMAFGPFVTVAYMIRMPIFETCVWMAFYAHLCKWFEVIWGMWDFHLRQRDKFQDSRLAILDCEIISNAQIVSSVFPLYISLLEVPIHLQLLTIDPHSHMGRCDRVGMVKFNTSLEGQMY